MTRNQLFIRLSFLITTCLFVGQLYSKDTGAILQENVANSFQELFTAKKDDNNYLENFYSEDRLAKERIKNVFLLKNFSPLLNNYSDALDKGFEYVRKEAQGDKGLLAPLKETINLKNDLINSIKIVYNKFIRPSNISPKKQFSLVEYTNMGTYLNPIFQNNTKLYDLQEQLNKSVFYYSRKRNASALLKGLIESLKDAYKNIYTAYKKKLVFATDNYRKP